MKIKELKDSGRLDQVLKDAEKLAEEYIKPAESYAKKARIELSKSQRAKSQS